MGIISSIVEKRASSTLAKPKQWLVDLLGGNKSIVGIRVDEKTALTYSAFFCGVKIYAETIAQLPLHLYERVDHRNKRKAINKRLYFLLHNQPNPEMTSFVYKETAQQHVLLWGNHYANIEWRADGEPAALWPLNPAKTIPRRNPKTKKIEYEVTLPDGEMRILKASEVFHLPGMGWNGLMGFSVLRLARESIGLGLATEEFGARFFANGAHPGGIIEYPGKLSDEAFERYKRDARKEYSGLSKSHRLMILEEGLKYHQTGIPPEDAQFLETRKFQIEEIARWLNLPPHMLKNLDRATFSNIEQQSTEFVTFSLAPWMIRWEQQLDKDLLIGKEKQKYYVKFNFKGLLRGDSQARAEFYNRMFQMGAFSPNDILELEDQNTFSGGDTRYVPLNMIPVEAENPKIGDKNRSEKQKELRELRMKRSVAIRGNVAKRYKKLLKKASDKIVNLEIEAVRGKSGEELKNRSAGNFESWLEEYYESFSGEIKSELGPVIQVFAEEIAERAAEEISLETIDNLQRFISDYIDNFAISYSRLSRNQLRKLVQEAIENELDLYESINEKLNDWEANRAEQIATEQATKVNGAISSMIFLGAGYSLFWVAGANACEYCLTMNGKKVSGGQPFLGKGESLEADGKEGALTVQRSVGHPPLHNGCQCGIAPG